MYDTDDKHGWTFVFGPIYAFRYNNLVVVTFFSKEILTWHHRRG